MINAIQIEDNTIYEYDTDCLRCKEELIKKQLQKEADMLALLLCLHATKQRKDV